MEFRVHKKLRQSISNENRDIALISAPGMGLSTLLKGLHDTTNAKLIWLDTSTILSYWEREYKSRQSNRRYVIHAATIRALIQSNHLNCAISDEDIFKSNLLNILKEQPDNINIDEERIILIDNFELLPDDLAKLICDELKRISDKRFDPGYEPLRYIRFLIAGAINFYQLYGESTPGVSPATNFYKLYRYKMLLSSKEVIELVSSEFPGLSDYPNILDFISNWSGGYLYYVIEFARWILEQHEYLNSMSVQSIISHLIEEIEEQNKISLFRYCYKAWNYLQDLHSEKILSLLERTISSGYLRDTSMESRKLADIGIVIEIPGTSNAYRPSNKLIELFFRQRLFEQGRLLPVRLSTDCTDYSQNTEAYQLIFEIENRLRNFIGDRLFTEYGNSWYTAGFHEIRSAGGSMLSNQISERREQDRESIYSSPDILDPELAFLDFPDLSTIIQANSNLFPRTLATELPSFLNELNYYRRRVAHNRYVTTVQVNSLKRRWEIIQKMMIKNI